MCALHCVSVSRYLLVFLQVWVCLYVLCVCVFVSVLVGFCVFLGLMWVLVRI